MPTLLVGRPSSHDEDADGSEVPYGTTRFCWLKDQINREDDTLRIGRMPRGFGAVVGWPCCADGCLEGLQRALPGFCPGLWVVFPSAKRMGIYSEENGHGS